MSDIPIQTNPLTLNERLKANLRILKTDMAAKKQAMIARPEIKLAKEVIEEICSECAYMFLGKIGQVVDEFDWPSYQKRLESALDFLSDSEREVVIG